MGLGLLFTFQGLFVTYFSGTAPGSKIGFAHALLPFVMFYIRQVAKWTITERSDLGTGSCPKDKFDGLLQIFTIGITLGWMILQILLDFGLVRRIALHLWSTLFPQNLDWR